MYLKNFLILVALIPAISIADCVVPYDARGTTEPTLCAFGADSEYSDGIPFPYRTSGGRDWDRLITPQEEFNILKRLTVRYKHGNDGILRNAVSGGTTPNSRSTRRQPTVRKGG